MKKSTNRFAAICLLAALVMPTFQPAIGAAPRQIADVGLTASGELVGQVINHQGQPVANSPVEITATGQQPKRATTDAQGYFSMETMPAGVYLAATPGTTKMVRVWAPQTAPPAASNGLLLVESAGTARAQDGQGFLRTHWVKIAIGLGIAGGVIAIIENNDDAS